MKLLKVNLLSAVILVFGACAEAQIRKPVILQKQLRDVTTYTQKDGLPSNSVYCFAEDDFGYIWLATDNGLCRFDSEVFETFTKEQGLPENSIIDLKKAPNGIVWGRTYRHHFFTIDPAKRQIEESPIFIKLNEVLKRYQVEYWYIDSAGVVWIAVYGDAGWVPGKPPLLKVFSFRDNKLQEHPFVTESNRNHNFFYGTIGEKIFVGYNYKRRHNYNPVWYVSDSLASSFCIDEVWHHSEKMNTRDAFLPIGQNKTIVSRSNLIFTLDMAKQEVLNFLHVPEDIVDFQYFENHGIWFNMVNGGGVAWSSTPRFDTVYNYLSGHTVTHVFKTRSGGMWMGLEGEGICYSRPQKVSEIYAPTDIKSLVKGLMSHGSRTFFVKDDTMGCELKNTNRGWKVNTQFESKQPVQKIEHFWCNPQHCISVVIDPETMIIRDKSHSRLIDLDNQRYTRLKPINDRKLFGSGIGFKIIDVESGYDIRSGQDIGFAPPTNDFLILGKNHFLMASNPGLFQYKNGHVSVPYEESELEDTEVLCLLKGPKNRIWCGTKDDGVLVYDSTFNLISKSTTNNGLPSNRINAMIADENGLVWLGTGNGLAYMGLDFSGNYTTTIVRGVSEFLDTEIRELSLHHSAHILVNSSKGLVAADIETLTNVTGSFQLFSRNVTVNDSNVFFSNNMSFSSGENDIVLSFGGFHYGHKDPEFWYRILGKKSQWVSTKNNQIPFSNMNPGDYEVQVSSIPEFDSAHSLSYKFSINPPFIQTWYFVLMVVSITALVLFAVFKTIATREKLKNNLMFSQQKALISQMNPHFIFNTLNSIRYYIDEKQETEASNYLIKFSRLIRSVLDSSVTGRIRLAEEIKDLEQYLKLEKLRFEEKLEFHLEVDTDVQNMAEGMVIPSMIIQPFVENAVIHGIGPMPEGGNIWLQFTIRAKDLVVIVKDDGVGRYHAKKTEKKRANEKLSLGTSNTQTRIALLNKVNRTNIRIETTDVIPSGTQVKLSIQVDSLSLV